MNADAGEQKKGSATLIALPFLMILKVRLGDLFLHKSADRRTAHS